MTVQVDRRQITQNTQTPQKLVTAYKTTQKNHKHWRNQ